MAAPVFDSSGAMVGTATSGAAHNVPCPATVNAGDVLIAFLMYEGTTVAPTDPSGWTLLTGPNGAATARTWVYGRIADGSEDGTNVNFGSPANTNNRYGAIYRFTGARDDTITNVVGGHGTDGLTQAQINDVGVTTPEADCLAVNLVGVADDNAVGSFTGESGGDWTEAEVEKTDTALTPDQCMQIQTATMASAGTINGGSFTMAASDPWRVEGFYIRGTSGGASETPTPGGAIAGGVTPSPKATATVGGAVVLGTTPASRSTVPQGGATAQGLTPAARVAFAPGGAIAGGQLTDPGGGIEETPIPGGAIAGGTSPSPSSTTTVGGATAAGSGPAARTALSAGGALAGGQLADPLEGGISETPTPGGALAGGIAPAPRASVAINGALVAGTGPAVRVSFTPGGALAGGQVTDPLQTFVTGFFDTPTPSGGSDPGTPSASLYDAPTPSRVRV